MQPVQRVAIIGAGNMGSGIAQKTAQEEFDVQMVDREAQWVERGQTIIADFPVSYTHLTLPTILLV